MKCCVPGCYFLKKSIKKVSLFRPKNLAQLEMWKEALPSVELTSDSRVCSRHFLSMDVIRKFVIKSQIQSEHTLLERERPTISPTAVPVFLMGGNSPKVPKKKIKRHAAMKTVGPRAKKGKIVHSLRQGSLNVDEVVAVPCECTVAVDKHIKTEIPFKFYLDRVYNLNLPGLKWRSYIFEKSICIAHIRKCKNQFYADKVLTLAENQGPLILLNGVKFMETSPDADLDELLKEMNAVKACWGTNTSGLCEGINRTANRYCVACQSLCLAVPGLFQ